MYSHQAPTGAAPTTRVPAAGPSPSAAAWTTVPAKSQPGTPAAGGRHGGLHLAAVERDRRHLDQRLAGSGLGQGTRPIVSRPGAASSTTTARISSFAAMIRLQLFHD